MFLKVMSLFFIFSSVFVNQAEGAVVSTDRPQEIRDESSLKGYAEKNTKIDERLEVAKADLEFGDFIGAYQNFKVAQELNSFNIHVVLFQERLAEALYIASKNDDDSVVIRRIYLEYAQELGYKEDESRQASLMNRFKRFCQTLFAK